MILLEVLDRRGRVKTRTRLARFPVSIGRSYKNDVIVDDRFVSPEHVRIKEDDGKLVAEDLGSLNGLRVPGSRDALQRVELRSDLRLRIGETVLRFVDEDAPVPEAQPLAAAGSRGLLPFLERKTAALGIIGASFGITVLDAYLETYQEMRWVDLLGAALGGLVLLLFWAGVWAFTNRLLAHRFDFARHLAFAYLMVVAMIVVQPAYEYFQFFTDSQTSLPAYAGGGVWLALLVMGHLSIIPSLARWRRAAWSCGVAASLVAATWLMQYSGESRFRRGISFSMPLKALSAEWLRATDLEAFLIETEELKEEIDRLALEE